MGESPLPSVMPVEKWRIQTTPLKLQETLWGNQNDSEDAEMVSPGGERISSVTGWNLRARVKDFASAGYGQLRWRLPCR